MDRAKFLVLALAPVAVLFGAPSRANATHVQHTCTNYTLDRSLNAANTTVRELANVLATHLEDHDAGRMH